MKIIVSPLKKVNPRFLFISPFCISFMLSKTKLMCMSKASSVPTNCLSPLRNTKTSFPLELFNKSSGLSIPLTIFNSKAEIISLILFNLAWAVYKHFEKIYLNFSFGNLFLKGLFSKGSTKRYLNQIFPSLILTSLEGNEKKLFEGREFTRDNPKVSVGSSKKP